MTGKGFEEEDDEDKGPILPEGVAKDILTAAPPSNWRSPKEGDDVEVHYVGFLQSDGSEFDSSRSKGQTFKFTLGKSQVIKGWELGVATMRKGEVAKFTLAPEFAYGDAGSPPNIPEKATLIFEIELLSWDVKDDLFSDGRVIKTQVKEGINYKTPKDHDETRLNLKVSRQDGSILDDRTSFDYVLGSCALGEMSGVVDKALSTMKLYEKVSLACAKGYISGNSDLSVTIDLELNQIYDIRDVSLPRDNSLIKKQLKEPDVFERPKDSAKVTLNVEAAVDGSGAQLPGFSAKQLHFTLGNGEVCDALEIATLEMKKGERAVLTCRQPEQCEEVQLGLERCSALEVKFTVELESFEKVKDYGRMSEDEKVEFAACRKDVGAKLFKGGRILLALERYKKVADMFGLSFDHYKEENKAKARELKKACSLNKAICLFKLGDFKESKAASNAVLKDDPSNVKALFRRAQADLKLKNFADCLADIKKLLETDPQNREARTLAKEAAAGQKEDEKKSKSLFGNMCDGLGKGPIPEPYKARHFDFEDED